LHTDIEIKTGVIEGFFGKPWDWSARLSSANFLRDAGYQFYIYAPKSASFLRRGWREPFPKQSLEHLRELGGRCRQSSPPTLSRYPDWTVVFRSEDKASKGGCPTAAEAPLDLEQSF
jgi:hypothetical protein